MFDIDSIEVVEGLCLAELLDGASEYSREIEEEVPDYCDLSNAWLFINNALEAFSNICEIIEENINDDDENYEQKYEEILFMGTKVMIHVYHDEFSFFYGVDCIDEILMENPNYVRLNEKFNEEMEIEETTDDSQIFNHPHIHLN